MYESKKFRTISHKWEVQLRNNKFASGLDVKCQNNDFILNKPGVINCYLKTPIRIRGQLKMTNQYAENDYDGQEQ